MITWVIVGVFIGLVVFAKTRGDAYWSSFAQKEKKSGGDQKEEKKEEKKEKDEKGKTPTTKTWWQKEWIHVITAGVAYLLLWFCLRWYFPTSGSISTDGLMLLGGLIILVIIGLASPKGSALIICALLFITVVIGMISRLGDKGYLPKQGPETVVSAPIQTVPSFSGGRKIVARVGHWTSVHIPCHQDYVDAKVSPADAIAYVKLPNGRVIKIGRGHENDDWGRIDGGNGLWQSWAVSTGDSRPVTCTFLWR